MFGRVAYVGHSNEAGVMGNTLKRTKDTKVLRKLAFLLTSL